MSRENDTLTIGAESTHLPVTIISPPSSGAGPGSASGGWSLPTSGS
jgi:hypothetical protein